MSKGLEERLAELALLLPNWDSYDATVIGDQALLGCRAFMESVSLVPTSKGGVQMEWHALGLDLEIEIAPDGTICGIMQALEKESQK